jgi:nucleoside-diphosphate-sugar epimerase
MLYLGNLVDVLMLCMTHPGAAGNTYLVSDGDDVATPVLISTMASAMGRPDRLWRCPVKVLELVAGLTGRAAEANRLLGSLMIDSSRIRRELGWKPPYSLRAGIQETVDWFMQQKNRDNG